MNIQLHQSSLKSNSEITITGSKSETNRLLLLQALYPEIQLRNTSNSDDSEVMIKALFQTPNAQLSTSNSHPDASGPSPNSQLPTSISQLIDVHHAGTAMRFLTAYFAIQSGREVVLTGSSRMKERPIKILVEALQQLGAEISYEENYGFPPIKIRGKNLLKNKVSLQADVSSQYISALLLIAPKLENGLELTLEGKITSIPYIEMTLALLNEIGVETTFENSIITIKPKSHDYPPNSKLTIPNSQLLTPNALLKTVESDWSSASYFYSLVALSEIGTAITLSSFKRKSLQGDSVLAEIYQDFGVQTVFNENNSITISKVNDNFNGNNQIQFQNIQPTTYNQQLTTYNLQNSPDIAQTIAVTCFGLGIGCHLTGLHTLKIKETDRLQALKNELEKLGATVSITPDRISIKASESINENIILETYQDHRMAMAFAPLALKTSLIIEDAEVVSKSYPDFWKDLKSCGILMSGHI